MICHKKAVHWCSVVNAGYKASSRDLISWHVVQQVLSIDKSCSVGSYAQAETVADLCEFSNGIVDQLFALQGSCSEALVLELLEQLLNTILKPFLICLLNTLVT